MRNINVEKDNKILELSLINDSLQKDVVAKEREIRRLNKDLEQYEQTMARMTDEMNPDVPKKDAEVMAGMCCTGTECGDLVPVKDIGDLLREETSKYRERIQSMETSLKSSRVKMRAVHKINLGLIEELSTLRRLCLAVDVERRDARLKLDLEGQIVKQMVRQLRQAKAQDSCPCVATSTPDGTQELPNETEISIIPLQPQPSITLSDDELEEALRVLSAECHKQCHDVDNVYEQSTLRLDTPNRSQSPRDHSGNPPDRSPSDKSENTKPDPSKSVRSVDFVSELNQSPRKDSKIKSTKYEQSYSPTKQSEGPVPEQRQIMEDQHENLVFKHNQGVEEQSNTPIPEQTGSPRKPSKDPISENSHSPRKQSIDPTPERIQCPKKQIKIEPVSPEPEASQNTVDTSELRRPTYIRLEHFPKRNLSTSEKNEEISSEQCQCESSCDENQMENVICEKSRILQNQNPELKQSSRRYSKIPVPEHARYRNEKQVPAHSQSSISPSEFTKHKSKPKFMHLEHFPKKISSISEIDDESSETQSSNEEIELKIPDQSQSPRKSSTIEQSQSSTATSEYSQGPISPNEFTRPKSKLKFMHLEHFPKKPLTMSEIDEESSERQSSNERSTSAIPEQSQSPVKTTERNQSSTETSDNTKPTFLRLNIYHFPKKDLSTSGNDEEISAKGCQCDCSCDETNQTDTLPSASDKSTISDGNQKWLVMPEGIKKGLEALRQSFLGKSEDYSGIWFNKAAGTPPSFTTPDRDTADRNTTENTSNSQKREKSSSLSQTKPTDSSDVCTPRRKKLVKIQIPEGTNKCDMCDPSEACEDDHDGCHAKDSEMQYPERTERSQGAPTLTTEDDSDLKSRTSFNRESLGADDSERGIPKGIRGILRVKLLKEESTQDSGGGLSCAGVCDRYYRDKLMATLQILENKEETIRIQSSSLGVAEGRIAELTKRATSMRQELDHKARELSKLRQFADSYQVDKSDASIMAEIQDAETQKLIVETLEDNLSVIEDLYRECFYETVKQEDLIDLLRKSYLDVRLMERDKTDKITRLQNVVLTQKRSLEQCQDVVMEVESLKSEISSFLNSSNNDSGMWERGSECPDVGEELADILEQLRQLQAMLTGDCTCGLDEENKLLKQRNGALEVELDQARHRNKELDAALRKLLEQQYEKQLKEKEREFQEIREKLTDVENTCKERLESCETLKRQLQQAQVMLDDKSAELVEVQQVRAAQDATIKQLRQDLEKSEQSVQEGLRKLAETTQLRSEQVLESQAAISELERRLQGAVQRCRQLEQTCREKERATSELQASLEDAQARGASLCEESRRVTARVRGWMRHKRALLSEQQEKIKRQEAMLRQLQSSVAARQSASDRTSQSETEPCCSNSIPREYQASDMSYPRCSRLNKPMCRSETGAFSRCGPSLARCVERETETASCSKCVSNRQESRERLSGSEMASCSQTPVPPRRQKRQSCDDFSCPWSPVASRERFEPDIRWARVPGLRRSRRAPADAALARVERLHAALAAGQRRWGRASRR